MKPFMSLFQMLPPRCTDPFAHCEVLSIDHETLSNTLQITLRDPQGQFPPVEQLAQNIAQYFQVSRTVVRVVAPLSVFDIQQVQKRLQEKIPSVNGFLQDAHWTVTGHTLTASPLVNIPPDLVDSLAADCLSLLSELYESLETVSIVQVTQELNTTQVEQKRSAKLQLIKESMPQPVTSSAKALLGQPFAGKVSPMSKITAETVKVCVEGRVFAVNTAETRAGIRLNFDITDGQSAVRVQKFFPFQSDYKTDSKFDPKTLLKLVREGDAVMVRGQMEWRRFGESEEQVLRPMAIQTAELPLGRMDTAQVKRVELHLHTNMSNMDALTEPDKLLKRCAQWGHKAVAITDHGVIHAFPEMMKARFKHIKDDDFKVLYGCEAYLVDDPAKLHGRQAFHIILFAKNMTGLRNLFELVSKAHIDNFHRHPNLWHRDIETHREGLIIGSACEAGELFSAMVHNEPWERLLEISEFYDYLEIQPICNNMFMLEKKLAMDVEQLREFNRTICRLGTATGKPVAATGDVHFLEPEDEIYRKILLESKGMTDGNPLPLYFRTTEEMLAEFDYLGTEKAYEVVVTNTNLIAGWMEAIQPVRKENFPPHIDGSVEELKHLVNTRAAELYGQTVPAHIAERIQTELTPIIGKGYDVIYMAAQKLVSQSIADGYLVGSRGSVGSSIVAYLSGITEVNALTPHYRCPHCKWSEFPETPLTAEGESADTGPDLPPKNCPVCGHLADRDGFSIPFATFLGFNADKQPDIDLNFSGEYQSKAHQNTIKLFGEKSVFRAGTVATVAAKTAVGFVLKYQENHGLNLSSVEIARLAKGCEGVRRSTGQHPGGLIVVPRENDINEFTPVQFPANKAGDIITTHFDYHAIEDNLLKLDLLGHDDPTMIKHLEDMTGIKVGSIDLGDRAVMSMFTTSEVLGYTDDEVLGPSGAVAVPEFGTRFVRQMLMDTMPTTFDELIRISGLSHGTDVWIGNAADLVAAGTATLKQIICARDDIMLYLISKGMDRLESFKIMESVRKGKGLQPEWEVHMTQCDVPAWYILSCKKIKYMFPKAHAVAYVMSAFRIAWFKVNHPKAFYSAYFSIRADSLDVNIMMEPREKLAARISDMLGLKSMSATEKDKLTLLEVCYEFRLRGFVFEPIDVFESDAEKFIITQTGLRLPFIAQPGLGGKAANSIVTQREISPFISADDIASRCVGLDKTNLEALKKMGALGDLPDSMQISLFG